MIEKETLREQIERHIEGLISLENLVSWAEQVYRDEEMDPAHREQLEEALSMLREATDPHRFRWEEPDLDRLLESLEQ